MDAQTIANLTMLSSLVVMTFVIMIISCLSYFRPRQSQAVTVVCFSAQRLMQSYARAVPVLIVKLVCRLAIRFMALLTAKPRAMPSSRSLLVMTPSRRYHPGCCPRGTSCHCIRNSQERGRGIHSER